MAPIRKGDGTQLEIPGVSEVRTGDGRVFFDDAIPDAVEDHGIHYLEPSTLQVTNGSVDEWEDQIGDLTLTGNAGTATVEGVTVPDFNGTDENLDDDRASNFSQPFAIAAAIEVDTLADSQPISGESQRVDVQIRTEDTVLLNAGENVFDLDDNSLQSDLNVVGGIFDGSSSEPWVNDAQGTTTGNVGSNDLDGITLGSRHDDSDWYDGKVMEVAWYDWSSMSTSELSSEFDRLSDKWGDIFA